MHPPPPPSIESIRELDQARARFREALAPGGPDDGSNEPARVAERHFAEGLVALAAGLHTDAEASLRAAVEAAGEHPMALKMAHAYGQALDRLGRHEEAAAVFRQIVELRPDLLDPWIWLGLALLGADRNEEALAVHRDALARHGRHPELARLFADGAVALDRLGRHVEAVAWCNAALQEHGVRDGTLLLNLAAFYLRLGDRGAARDVLRRVREEYSHLGAEAESIWLRWGDGGPL